MRDWLFVLAMSLVAILLAWVSNTRVPMPPFYLRTMQAALLLILLGFLYLYVAPLATK